MRAGYWGKNCEVVQGLGGSGEVSWRMAEFEFRTKLEIGELQTRVGGINAARLRLLVLSCE